MMCAQMTQGKASLFARVHKITRSSPHLQLSSFYHSPPTSTTKLLRSSSDTMARFSPQQSRPVHATPFMNHSTAPSYVLATFMRETKKKKKNEALYWFNIVQPCSIGLFNDPFPSAYPLTLFSSLLDIEMPTMTLPTLPTFASTCAHMASHHLAPRATKPRRLAASPSWD